MNEMIEKLKDKDYVRAFGLMKPEEQECLKKVRKENCVIFNDTWALPYQLCQPFENRFTYAIKPDYQPEPEFVDLEIVEGKDGFLGVYNKEPIPMTNFPFVHLHCLPSLPNFEGFYMPDPVITDGHEYLFIGTVARNIAEGKKVYARFRS